MRAVLVSQTQRILAQNRLGCKVAITAVGLSQRREASGPVGSIPLKRDALGVKCPLTKFIIQFSLSRGLNEGGIEYKVPAFTRL